MTLPDSDTYQTPCYGEHALFDSRKPDDQARAKALCMGCKVRPACQRLLDDTLSSVTMRSAIQGTWAGKTFTPPPKNAPKPRPGQPLIGRYPKGSHNPCDDCGLVGPIWCRDRCRPCYRRLNLAEQADDYKSRLSRDEITEEWAAFPKRGRTHRENVADFANFLGRRASSVDRSLQRAGITAATYLTKD